MRICLSTHITAYTTESLREWWCAGTWPVSNCRRAMARRLRRIAGFYGAVVLATHVVTTAYRVCGGSWNSLDTFVVANGIMVIPGLMAVIFARWVFHEPIAPALGLR